MTTAATLMHLDWSCRRARRARADRDRSPTRWAMSSWARGFFLVHATALTVTGLGLYLAVETFDVLWPWPITRLAAAVTGAFLLTMAAGSWYALRSGDRWAFRLAAPLYLVFPAGQLLTLAVFRGDLGDGVAPWGFAVVLVLWLLAFAVVVRAQDGRRPA